MTRISKCDALAMSVLVETPEQMFTFAQSNAIPEMAEQAKTMILSAIAVRIMLPLSPLLALVTYCYTKPDSRGEYVLTGLSAVNTAVSAYALKRLYNTACYLQNALNQYPRLRASLLRTV